MKKRVLFLFIFLLFFFILPNFYGINYAIGKYGVKDGSNYEWFLIEKKGTENIHSIIKARFNTKQNKVVVIKIYQKNGTSIQFNYNIPEFNKCIIDIDTRAGAISYFYTAKGSLKLPRNVVISEIENITQITDYQTGIVLYYNSEIEEYELKSGEISISWVVWVVLES